MSGRDEAKWCGMKPWLDVESETKSFLIKIRAKSSTCAVHTRPKHGHNRKEGCKRRKNRFFGPLEADRPGKNN